jgi:hypothetical protein
MENNFQNNWVCMYTDPVDELGCVQRLGTCPYHDHKLPLVFFWCKHVNSHTVVSIHSAISLNLPGMFLFHTRSASKLQCPKNLQVNVKIAYIFTVLARILTNIRYTCTLTTKIHFKVFTIGTFGYVGLIEKNIMLHNFVLFYNSFQSFSFI